VDEEEIAEARWFSRAQLAEAVRTAELLLPGRASIARALIESWYGDELSD
jgi:NAD+ diphosphatase